MNLRNSVFAMLAAIAGAGAAHAQEPDQMGQSCDWLKRSGVKYVAPGGDYAIKVLIGPDGTIFWNGETLAHRKALMDKVADEKKKAKDFPATLVEASVETYRTSVQPVFRIFNDAKVNPACGIHVPPPAPAPEAAPPAAPADAPAAAPAAPAEASPT